MSIRNLEGKLQETIVGMQEIGSLLGDANSMISDSKDTTATKSMIVQLKQNILNQTEQKVADTQSQLDTPPMKISFKDFKVQFVIDTEAIEEINANLNNLRQQMNLHEFALEDAQTDVEISHKEANAHSEIKDLLETELESLNTQASGIMDAIRSERSSNLDTENLKKDKPEDTTENKNKEANKQSNGYKGFSSYINDNNHVIDFEKTQNDNSETETHIEAVD